MVERGRRPFDDLGNNGHQINPELRDMVHACLNQTPQGRPFIDRVLEKLKESFRLAVESQVSR